MDHIANRKSKSALVTLAVMLFVIAETALGQSTAFSYQGRLTDASNPANGSFDIQFKLFSTPDVGTGTQQGPTITNSTVQVTNGVFSVQLDYGNVFDGSARYLEISLRPAGSPNPRTVLSPRQPLTSTPYAVRSATTATADTATNTTQLGGLPPTRFVQFNPAGNVGIGTTNPTSKLEIAAQDGLAITGFQPFMTLRDTNTNLRSILAGGNGDFGFYPASFIGGSPAVIIRNNTGNVGIATTNPTSRLHVQATGPSRAVFGDSVGNIGVFGNSVGSVGVFGDSDINDGVRGRSASGTGIRSVSDSGDLFAGQGRDLALRFRVTNSGQVRSDIGFTTPAADFAELMELEESGSPETESSQPGDVLIISPETGKLRKSSQPYSRLVAGVYSTKPGFLGGQNIDGSGSVHTVPLALVGIVPTKASAENGAIRPGDILTTSSTPGYAMKASAVRVGRVKVYRSGTILGKALEPLNEGTGIIKVLVTLR